MTPFVSVVEAGAKTGGVSEVAHHADSPLLYDDPPRAGSCRSPEARRITSKLRARGWKFSSLMNRRQELDRLYAILGALKNREGGPRTLAGASGHDGWPERGVYFFFEEGEVRENGEPRVVRVGTHAVTTDSRSTLWKRLRQHRGRVGGRHPGGGNHRASIFRRHVGHALLARGGFADDIAATWSRRHDVSAEERHGEYALELAVSRHIGRMPLLWVAVDDAPGPPSARGFIEANAIALLSNVSHPAIDTPSQDWLGRDADKEAIRESGLWNVNHVAGACNPALLDELERYAEAT